MKRKIICISIIGMFLLTSFSALLAIGQETNVKNEKIIVKENIYNIFRNNDGYTPRESIRIFGDDEFTEENGVTGGNGTENDPYIIEKWEITDGVFIYYTTAHFIIRDCFLHCWWGITFRYMENGVIQNCIFYSEESYSWGIYINHSSNNVVEYCTILTCNGEGIRLMDSNYNEIHHCTISGSTLGLGCFDNVGNLIHHNNVFKNRYNAYGSHNTGQSQWDDGQEGNYWDDYGERYPDATNDGSVWNTPYTIPKGDDQDNYPLVNPASYGGNQFPIELVIEGPISGGIRTYHEYKVKATDPDGDQLYYMFDWGDDSDKKWIGPYASDTDVTVKHKWMRTGTYTIKVVAVDERGLVSEEATLEVSMPRSRTSQYSFLFLRILEQLMERFPILEQRLLTLQ